MPRQETAQLVDTYQPRIKAFVRKRVSSEEDSQDIVQEVFYQLARAESMAQPIEQVAAWLYRVARNLIINRGVKKREEQMPTMQSEEDGEIFDSFAEILFSDDSTPESDYLRSLVWEELDAALGELPPEQREVFELTELQGLSMKDISAATGVGVNTLLSRKRYAVLYLRERLQELYDELLEG